MDLGDPQTAESLMSHVSNGGTLAQFAEAHGLDRKTMTRRLRDRPDLKDGLAAARFAAKAIAHHAPRMLSSATPLGLPSRDEFVAYLWETAKDPDHRACAKCAGILAEIILAPEVLEARRKDAELSAGPVAASQRPVVVALPAVDRPVERGVIDAEVVDV